MRVKRQMNRFDTEENQRKEKNKVCTDCTGGDSAVIQNNVDPYKQYRRVHYKNTIPDSRILVFLTGFCIGMVFFYLSGGSSAGAFDGEQLVWLKNMELNYTGLLGYVFRLRFGQLAFCVICAFSTIGGVLAYLIMGWYGFELGVVIFSLVYQYGLKGIFLTLSMFVPQGILYAAIFLIIFHKYWEGNGKYYHKEEAIKKKGILAYLNMARKPAVVLALFCIAILCEVYVNPVIVKKIALFF